MTCRWRLTLDRTRQGLTRQSVFCLLLIGFQLLRGATGFAAEVTPRVEFQRDIRPILSDKCFYCHGPDAEHRAADLRLDTREGLYEHSGARVLAPGNPDKSALWQRVTHADPEQRMPPAESGKSLTDAELARLRQWIEQGGEWQNHWAYEPVRRPEVPSGPATLSTAGPLDRLVGARLQQAGIDFAPSADPATLLRRLSLDLIGLPPTPAEVAEFTDETRRDPEGAWQRQVDRLLAAPHFGERLAIYWLDLVRYADTVGYHGDQEHHISPYRDYVIQAFNDNLPFDQFTREQLAGDLIPESSIEQKIASGYNRLLQTSHEGGVQQKEYLAKYASDRVRNFGSVWLGATLQCCECHDHKFDPLPQRDFYRIAAFFSDIDDFQSFKSSDSSPAKREPELEVTTRLRPELPRRTLITVALKTPRSVRVLGRGDWMDESGEVVEPGVPTIFRQLPAGQRATRLDLAAWLTAPDNPLTARVFVNRLWKLYFGKGLASRLDDFGAQGAAPVAPEVLDWLAAEFMETGWDVKHLIRLMVSSRVYRQSSATRDLGTAGPDLDPAIPFFARQQTWRLEAELVRDSLLQVSGLLNREMGGRSARPYQPDGYYQFLNFPKRTYQADSGDRQYRRGVYTHWQRAYLHPMLKAFDAPSREECTCERPQSITPQSALVLLNDTTSLEAARALAGRIVSHSSSTDRDRLVWAWREALTREPGTAELALLMELLAAERQEFAARPEAVHDFLAIGQTPVPAGMEPSELAAWTSVVRAILNTSEFVMRP